MDTTITDGLDRDIAALKAKAADYGAQHKVIDGITWPNGARLAVNFTADFDTMLLRRLMNEPPSQLAKGEFGGRVGIWRLIELFDSHRIKATIFTPGRICELYPDSLRAAAKSGHEIADHMWEHRVPKEPELERDHLQQDHRGDREDCRQEAGRHAQQPQPRAAAGARLLLRLRRIRWTIGRTG